MALASVSILIAVIVLKCHHKRGTKRAPRWLRVVCFKVGMRALCFRRHIPHVEGSSEVQVENRAFEKKGLELILQEEDERKRVTSAKVQNKELQQILALLLEFKREQGETKQEELYQYEYVLIGTVIDRLFFWLTLFAFAVTCAIIFTSFPTTHT